LAAIVNRWRKQNQMFWKSSKRMREISRKADAWGRTAERTRGQTEHFAAAPKPLPYSQDSNFEGGIPSAGRGVFTA
jgi:hypothetical protein